MYRFSLVITVIPGDNLIIKIPINIAISSTFTLIYHKILQVRVPNTTAHIAFDKYGERLKVHEISMQFVNIFLMFLFFCILNNVCFVAKLFLILDKKD